MGSLQDGWKTRISRLESKIGRTALFRGNSGIEKGWASTICIVLAEEIEWIMEKQGFKDSKVCNVILRRGLNGFNR
jgi:hypothetical protein